MTVFDQLGPGLTGAGEANLSHYNRGLHQLQCFIGDPVGSVDSALAEDPGFVMAHAVAGQTRIFAGREKILLQPVFSRGFFAMRDVLAGGR